MKITRECDYAIRITLLLCSLGDGEIASASAIAESQCVPRQFTLKILRELIGVGLVESFKGTHGGYRMKVTPEQITLKDVISAIDGEIAINECLECDKECNRVADVHDCPVHRRLEELNSLIIKQFESVSFADLLKDCKENKITK